MTPSIMTGGTGPGARGTLSGTAGILSGMTDGDGDGGRIMQVIGDLGGPGDLGDPGPMDLTRGGPDTGPYQFTLSIPHGPSGHT